MKANSRNFHCAEGLRPLSLRTRLEQTERIFLEDAFCIATFFHAFPSETILEEKKLFLKRPKGRKRIAPWCLFSCSSTLTCKTRSRSVGECTALDQHRFKNISHEVDANEAKIENKNIDYSILLAIRILIQVYCS
ncbi:hypothetical protein TNCV_730531 [Trichonephila clavipes]|nr:hypothetical protein TNCV_730531 [Trichonephila clavipes]